MFAVLKKWKKGGNDKSKLALTGVLTMHGPGVATEVFAAFSIMASYFNMQMFFCLPYG